MKTLATISLSAVCLASAMLAAENTRLVVRAVGQFDTPGTLVYSVFLASRQEKLSGLSIRSALPAGTRFLENLDIPAAAAYEGVAGDVVQWSVAALDRDTLLGPFTFRVKIDSRPGLGIVSPPQRRPHDPRALDIPAAPAFSVSYQLPVPEVLIDPGVSAKLLPLAESGSITFDQQGTIDVDRRNGLVAVGDTGILIYVPQGAVDRSVTLTFRRLPVDDDKVPQGARDTWWCGLYQMSITPRVDFTKPIAYALPTRRPIPAGLNVRAFASADSKDWREQTTSPVGSSPFTARLQFGSGFGCQTMPFGYTTCSNTPACGGSGFSTGCPFGGGSGFGAFGVNSTDRVQGSITGAALSQQFGTTVQPTQIQDGTSNTIIAILIGLR
jgi:hypothetical protein